MRSILFPILSTTIEYFTLSAARLTSCFHSLREFQKLSAREMHFPTTLFLGEEGQGWPSPLLFGAVLSTPSQE
jgi:hypothetical protein